MSKAILFSCLFWCLLAQSFAQSFNDSIQQLRFANYLFESAQYRFALEEYNRFAFTYSANDTVLSRTIHCYRFLKMHQKALENTPSFFSKDASSYSRIESFALIKFYIDINDFNSVSNVVSSSSLLKLNEKHNFQMGQFLLERKWETAYSFFIAHQDVHPKLMNLSIETVNFSFKSPSMAAAMSAILPGSGKVYAGRWQDGLISFIFVGANAFQAYRGFSKYGKQSTYGWIFTGITLGFYSGNIYGAFKATKDYNKKAELKFINEAKDILYSIF